VRRGVAVMVAAAATVLGLTGAGCGSVATTVTSETTVATGAGTAATTSTSTSLPASTTIESGPSVVDEGLAATTVATGLRVPWEMRFLPDGRVLVTERGGRIVMVDVGAGGGAGGSEAGPGAIFTVGEVPVAEIGEGGLLGLALDPDFPSSPYIYVSYTYRTDGGGTANRVSRVTLTGLDSTGPDADASTLGNAPTLDDELVLVDGIPGASIHNGSRVAFGSDGYLWVTTGDGAVPESSQDPLSLNGKVLRMTTDGTPAPGNPFPEAEYPGSLVYALGLRNSQGLVFHPVTGEAYVTEHGPATNDEVNRIVAGGNYGWPLVGGRAGDPRFIDAITDWSPTIAPAGAVFYEAELIPWLQGAFVFVTLKEADVRVLLPDSPEEFTAVREERVLFDGEFGRLRAAAVGPDGALYVSTSNRDGRGSPGPGDDRIIRIAPAE